jgi:hypothetical protein
MIMKPKLLIIILSLCALGIAIPSSVPAGFQDLLKGAMQSFQGGGSLTDSDIIQGLKQALEVGSSNAVGIVSKVNGYYDNPEIKIPLPGNVQKVEKILQAAGFGQQIDDFELSMNRAAERAAPEAKPIFLDAIKQMSFDDARKILNGGDNAATLYFKEKTSNRLQTVFKPTVHQAMTEVGVTNQYETLESKVKTIPFADMKSFDLDQYVTGKSLDGLFFMLGQEEKKIREDPAARVTDLLKKVFGSK